MKRKDGLEGKSDEEIARLVLVTLTECGIEVNLTPGEFNFTPLSPEDYQDDPDLLCALLLPSDIVDKIPRLELEESIKRGTQVWLDNSVDEAINLILNGTQTEEVVGLFED